jgi:hypothetical protein
VCCRRMLIRAAFALARVVTTFCSCICQPFITPGIGDKPSVLYNLALQPHNQFTAGFNFIEWHRAQFITVLDLVGVLAVYLKITTFPSLLLGTFHIQYNQFRLGSTVIGIYLGTIFSYYLVIVVEIFCGSLECNIFMFGLFSNTFCYCTFVF